MKRSFRNYRDDRFALTTLQNPNLEVRTCPIPLRAFLIATTRTQKFGKPMKTKEKRFSNRNKKSTPAQQPLRAQSFTWGGFSALRPENARNKK